MPSVAAASLDFPPNNLIAFPEGETVYVWVDPSVSSDILTGMQAWNGTNGITIQPVSSREEAVSHQFYAVVIPGPSFGSTTTGQTENDGNWVNVGTLEMPNWRFSSFTISINPNIPNSGMRTRADAHEWGHTLGLDDRSGPPEDTVMCVNCYDWGNAPTLTGPTTCDKELAESYSRQHTPDFSLNIGAGSTPARCIYQGDSGESPANQFSVWANPVGGFNAPIHLAAVLPPVFTPTWWVTDTITEPLVQFVQLTLNGTAEEGEYPFTVQGSSGVAIRTASSVYKVVVAKIAAVDPLPEGGAPPVRYIQNKPNAQATFKLRLDAASRCRSVLMVADTDIGLYGKIAATFSPATLVNPGDETIMTVTVTRKIPFTAAEFYVHPNNITDPRSYLLVRVQLE